MKVVRNICSSTGLLNWLCCLSLYVAMKINDYAIDIVVVKSIEFNHSSEFANVMFPFGCKVFYTSLICNK